MKSLKKPGVVAIPLSRKSFLKQFGTPHLQAIAEKMEGLREEYIDSEKGGEVSGDYDRFLNQLYSICEDSPVEPDFQYDAVYTAAVEADVILLHLNTDLYADAFAILSSYSPDTYIHLLCSSKPGMGALLLKEVDRIAKQEGHTGVTADAINDSLVKYYAKHGFKKYTTAPAKYTGIVMHNFIMKSLAGGKRRKTQRRKLRRSLRVLNH